MFRWLTSLLGFETVKQPFQPGSTTLKAARPEISLEMKDWPEGSQFRKHKRFHEPDAWAHSNWAWRSNGYIDHLGSLHPKPDKAECRNCLGVLQCPSCEKIIRPSTKAKDMKVQLAQNCAHELLWITCEA